MMERSPILGFALVPGLIRGAPLSRALTARRSFVSRKRVRIATYACLPTNEASSSSKVDSNGAKPLSKSAQMAALLGQDTSELEKKGEQVKLNFRNDNRRKYGIVVATVVVTTVFFFLQKADVSSGLNLMTVLKQSSDPIEVVGTNGNPTMIEFSASWCENCKAMAPRVFDLEKQFAGRVNFIVVDGEDPARQQIVDEYGVDGIPQFSMVGIDGKVKGNLIGMVPKEILNSNLNALLHDEALPFPGLSLDELRAPPS